MRYLTAKRIGHKSVTIFSLSISLFILELEGHTKLMNVRAASGAAAAMSNATCRGGPATCRLQHNEAVRHVVIRAPRCAIAALTTVLLEASQPAVNSRALISVETAGQAGATVNGPTGRLPLSRGTWLQGWLLSPKIFKFQFIQPF